MLKNTIHAVITTTAKNTHICLNLTKKFQIQLNDESQSIKLTAGANRDVDFGIGSTHTLYGENGAGKTQVLLELAHIFNPSSRKQTAAVLYENDQGVFIRGGKALAGWKASGDGIPFVFSSAIPSAKSIFYTTSPYEYGRRKFPKNPQFRDVTPTFGQRNSFDALALLTLPDNRLDFIDKAAIRWKLNLFTTHEGIQLLSKSLQTSRPNVHGLERSLRPTLTRLLTGDLAVTFRVAFSLWYAARSMDENSDISNWLDQVLQLLPSEKINIDPSFVFALEGYMNEEAERILGNRYQSLKSLIYDLQGLRNQITGELSKAEFEHHFGAQLENSASDLRFLMSIGLLDFSLAKLSSGETAYLILLAAIHGALASLKSSKTADPGDPIFLLIDEGEMFLHPRWQREYLSVLYNFIINSWPEPQQVHLVISTHSLIVAADSPANTLIDIETGKLENAFGLGPLSTLESIYGVETFYGDFALGQLKKLQSFVSSNKRTELHEAKEMIKELADDEMRTAIGEQIDVRLRTGLGINQ